MSKLLHNYKKANYGRTFRKRRRKKKLLCDELPELNTENHNTLLKWMGEKGYRPSKKLRPHNFSGCGRGLMTEETIQAGDVIVSIPKQLLITPVMVLNSYLGPLFERHYPKASGHQILSLFVMCEKARGRASDWYPYIHTLPKTYSIPAFYSHCSIPMKPKSFYEKIKQQCESVKYSYEQLHALICDLETTFPVFKDALDFDLYKWAWCSVNTRCIYLECEENCCGNLCTLHLALAPFLDLLNHNVDVQVQTGFNREKQQYEIVSQGHLKKYSQVFISYGCHSNRKLLIEYGFVIPRNYNDSIPFSVDDIISAFQHGQFSLSSFSSKLKFIVENELMKNAMCSCDGLSWNLNVIIKILVSNYNVKFFESILHNSNVFAEKNYEQFELLKRKLVTLKLSEYDLNQDVKSNCKCGCSDLQLLISYLYEIENEMLIKSLS